MPRKGDGLYERGKGKIKTWYLDVVINGARYQKRLGKGITRSVAGELATIERGRILRNEAGIGRKRKDILFEKAKEQFVDWARVNKRPRTVRVYTQQLDQLAKSFNG